jgi:cellulose biosynthesis protein BcsQ
MAAPAVPERTGAVRIALFNHKGGVGKTTLTTNIAFALARNGKRVLLVDSDPQCNLTSYLIEDAVVNDLLDRSDSDDGQTLWSAVKPIAESTGDVRIIAPIEVQSGLFLQPGDVRLAEFEQELHTLWGESFQRRPRGFRGTTALSKLVNAVTKQHHIDYVFYDSGPNIGALNRVILLDCDFYVIPAACDLFSVRAIKTLGHTLGTWIRDWDTISSLAPDESYLFPGRPRLLGFIPQRYRVYGGRLATEYAKFIPKIEKAIQADVVTIMQRLGPSVAPVRPDALRLGDVRDFGSAANASQRLGVPLSDVESVSEDQRADAARTFTLIANEIVSRSAEVATA